MLFYNLALTYLLFKYINMSKVVNASVASRCDKIFSFLPLFIDFVHGPGVQAIHDGWPTTAEIRRKHNRDVQIYANGEYILPGEACPLAYHFCEEKTPIAISYIVMNERTPTVYAKECLMCNREGIITSLYPVMELSDIFKAPYHMLQPCVATCHISVLAGNTDVFYINSLHYNSTTKAWFDACSKNLENTTGNEWVKKLKAIKKSANEIEININKIKKEMEHLFYDNILTCILQF